MFSMLGLGGPSPRATWAISGLYSKGAAMYNDFTGFLVSAGTQACVNKGKFWCKKLKS